MIPNSFPKWPYKCIGNPLNYWLKSILNKTHFYTHQQTASIKQNFINDSSVTNKLNWLFLQVIACTLRANISKALLFWWSADLKQAQNKEHGKNGVGTSVFFHFFRGFVGKNFPCCYFPSHCIAQHQLLNHSRCWFVSAWIFLLLFHIILKHWPGISWLLVQTNQCVIFCNYLWSEMLFDQSSSWCQCVVNDLSIVSQTVVYTKRRERREGIVELAVV